MQQRVCTSMYLPIINNGITDHVQSCVPCKTVSNSQQNKPTNPMALSSRYEHNVYVFIILHNSKWYLLVANYYSTFHLHTEIVCYFLTGDFSVFQDLALQRKPSVIMAHNSLAESTNGLLPGWNSH